MHTTAQPNSKINRHHRPHHHIPRPVREIHTIPDAITPPAATPLLGKKTDVLHYYRVHNLNFLNLGSVLIGISDHLLYHFDAAGRVDWITELPA